MGASDALQPLQFTHGMVGQRHAIDATHPEHGYVGSLVLDPDGEVRSLAVNEEHQRRGVATALWQHAQELAKQKVLPARPRHSPERTPEGDAWARKVGGRLPKIRPY